MSAPDELFDRGLQPERTLLAWRRTCLAFAAASLIAIRFTVDTAGVVGVVIGIIGASLAIAAYFAATHGYRRARTSLARDGILTHSAWPLALATGATLMLGAACAVFLLLRSS